MVSPTVPKQRFQDALSNRSMLATQGTHAMGLRLSLASALILLAGCTTGVERAFEQCLVFGGSPKFERAGEAARVECQR